MTQVVDGFPRRILLVEDDPGDQELVKRAMSRANMNSELAVVEDGEQALEYLNHTGRYADRANAPLPDLVLLDLNLPRINGIEVLRAIRASNELRRLPVIALTTSHADADIDACYAAGVNAYVVKPSDPVAFTEFISSLGRFWFNVAALPSA